MPVIDTNLLIRLVRGDDKAQKAIRQLEGESLLLPAQAATRYLAGVEDTVGELATLQESFRLVHTTDAHLLEAARLASGTNRQGMRPQWADIQIAAVAALEGTYVVTSNKRDFTRLGVQAWNYMREQKPPGAE